MLPAPVQQILNEHITLTLATVGEKGHPAAAALFYALLGDRLIFLSEPNSRHVQDLLHHPRVAITVYKDDQPWKDIRGLQGEGEAMPLPEDVWHHAWRAYSGRFPFVERGRGAHNEGAVLAGPLARARWYTIRLTWVRLIDNTRGFGWKAEWTREEEGTWRRIR